MKILVRGGKMQFEKILDVVSEWSRGRVEAFEMFALVKEGLKIEKKDGRLETFQPYQEEGIALRVINRGALGFAYTADLSPETILKTAHQALEMANLLESEPQLSFPFPEACPDLRTECPRRLSPEEALARLESVESTAFAFDPRVKRLQEVGVRDQEVEIFLANSSGLQYSWRQRSYSLVAVVVAEEANEQQMGWEWQSAISPEDLAPEKIGREAAYRAVSRLKAKTMASTKTNVLFPPHIAVDLLELVSQAFCGDRVLKGKSPFAGKIGQRIFSSAVNILDHGLLKKGLETRPFDDEGVPQREKYLVRGGELEGFLFDHYWGQKSGQGSTGNARRGHFKAPPSVSPTNLFLSPHPQDPKTWREGRVFEVLEVLGMHTANPISGDFSVGVTGLFWEGKEAQPVAGMALSGNVFELFNRVEAVGNDLTFYGSIGAPSILVSEMDLAGG